MNSQWLAMEQYRLQCVEQWPEGPRKQAELAAIRSAMESLIRTSSLTESVYRRQ
jgi:hypothetical protein